MRQQMKLRIWISKGGINGGSSSSSGGGGAYFPSLIDKIRSERGMRGRKEGRKERGREGERKVLLMRVSIVTWLVCVCVCVSLLIRPGAAGSAKQPSLSSASLNSAQLSSVLFFSRSTRTHNCRPAVAAVDERPHTHHFGTRDKE